MKTEPNDTANPIQYSTYPNEHIEGGVFHKSYPGLTKREAFAMAAMQGICAQFNMNYQVNGGYASPQIAQDAVILADALIEALNK